MKKKKLISDAKVLFSDRIWMLDKDSLSKWKRKIVETVKLIRITFSTFAENRMGFQCVALSYFCALATVPLAAIIFWITGGLGLSDKIQQLIYTVIPADPEFLQTIMEKANNIIDTAQSGAVGFISALIFVWSILWMMFQVERVFNNVWGVRKVPRKIYRRFSSYIGLMILIPFIVMIFGAGIAFYANLQTAIGIDLNVRELKLLTVILGWLGFYAVASLIISVMYKWIPSPKVIYKYALKSALISGAFFVAFQYLYLETQMFVSRLNGVYGALAAIPLFLIWLNFSWQIIIYGAQLTYAFQHVEDYKLEETE